ncbi:hypothetical protein J4414_00095 [Candidatus Woesearchaeota archaeon]|nr:hypothetical protein [Candidatus Woesearchaeota archaeon]
MKKNTKETIGLIVLIIQLVAGIGLIIFGALFLKCENYTSLIMMAIGAFLLVGSGRKEISEMFSLFKGS